MKNGDIDHSPEDFFRKFFLEPLSDLLGKTQGALALLIPSVTDVMNEHAVFPQGALNYRIEDPVRRSALAECSLSFESRSLENSSPTKSLHLLSEWRSFRRPERRCFVSPSKGGILQAYVRDTAGLSGE